MITSIWTSPGEAHDTALELRRQVFQEELGWSQEEDCDFMDPYAYHLVLLLNDVPVAAGRLTYGGVDRVRLDRICVLKKYRRQGIGDGLVKILDFKAAMIPVKYSVVESTPALERFFGRIGFAETGSTTEARGDTLIVMEKETNDGTKQNCAHQCACP